MTGYSKYVILVSILLTLSVFTIFSMSEAQAIENIFINAKSFDNTIIVVLENGEDNTSNVKTVKIWVSPDNSFKSFKSEPHWGGGQYSNGQLLIFTAADTLKPGELVKFGVITDKKTSGINWKVLDENEITLGSGKISPQNISNESIVIEEDTKMIEEIKQMMDNIYVDQDCPSVKAFNIISRMPNLTDKERYQYYDIIIQKYASSEIEFDIHTYNPNKEVHDTSVLESYATGKKVKSRGTGEVRDPWEGYSPDLKADDYAKGGRASYTKGGLAKILGV